MKPARRLRAAGPSAERAGGGATRGGANPRNAAGSFSQDAEEPMTRAGAGAAVAEAAS